jgi:hypothetical protein
MKPTVQKVLDVALGIRKWTFKINRISPIGEFPVFFSNFVPENYKVIYNLGATDMSVPPQTNRMRYHKTFLCIQLETIKAQVKLFLFVLLYRQTSNSRV